jgi:CRP-like cAMP-binding protein
LTLRNTEDVKILTAEDPVEFNFPGVNQVNVVKEVGMTFAKALKAFLRQDPDICMIGEIRDLETGEIAVEAAMTGHLVLSTLHTNDAPSTVTRLADMGVAPFNVAAALILCSAQRLLRRVCPNCRQPLPKLPANKLIEAGFDPNELGSIQLYEGRGCPTCKGTGYKGRLGVFEVMENSQTLADAIASKVNEGQLRKIALKEGMLTLRQDGLLKTQQGMTTLAQVLEKTVVQRESLPHYLLNPDEQIFENGDVIIKEGNTDTAFYKLIQGCLEVYKGNNLIAEISQTNTYFGEMSSLVGSRRSATIKSQGRSIVKVFPGDKLGEVLDNYPDIAKQIINTLVLRLNESGNRLSELMQNRIELERTYVNQLTSSIGTAGASFPQGSRPIASAPRGAALGGGAIAMAAKPSALAKLAAKKGAAEKGATFQGPHPGGNGAAPPPATIVTPVAAPQAARTSVITQSKPAAPDRTNIPQNGRPAFPQQGGPATVQAQAAAAAGTPVPKVVRAVQATPPKAPQPLDIAGRTSFARNLMPADQTHQVKMAPGASHAAKILREAR